VCHSKQVEFNINANFIDYNANTIALV